MALLNEQTATGVFWMLTSCRGVCAVCSSMGECLKCLWHTPKHY